MSKNGFLLYKQQYEPIKHLDDEKLGKLFRAIFEHQTGGCHEMLPAECQMAFEFFKSQFKIDEKKYNKFVESQREKGRKSAAARRTKSTAVNRGQPNQPKSTYKDKDKVKDKDKDKNKEYTKWVEAFNKQVLGAKYGYNKGVVRNFVFWRESYSLEDMIVAIGQIPKHDWLKDKATPELVLRQTDKNRQPVDRIGQLLSLSLTSEELREKLNQEILKEVPGADID